MIPTTERMYKYKSFISYSRAADSRLAPELKSALQRFAKPWYQLRAIQVFCDQTNLTANPDLWNSIKKSLDNTEYFIYLASPQAAQSKWVKKELEVFKQKRSAQNIIVVLTDGNILWDDKKQDFTWSVTNAIPTFDKPLFEHESTWIDLTWIRKEQLSSRDPRFLDAVANLSSTIRNIDKDTLIGKDVEEHRKAKRFRLFSIIGLSLLALFLLAATVVAIQSEKRSQQRLVRTFTGNGSAMLETGDYLLTLPWYVEAMMNERDDDRKEAHTFRVNNLMNQVPSLMQAWNMSSPVIKTAFLKKSHVLIISGEWPNWNTNEFDCYTKNNGFCGAVIKVMVAETGKDLFDSIVVKDGIKATALSHDSNTLATLSVTNILRLWNLQNGKLVWKQPCDNAMSTDALSLSIAFNKKGTNILVAKSTILQVFETLDGTIVAKFNTTDNSQVNQAAFLDNEKIIFLNNGCKVWNVKSKTLETKKISFLDVVHFQISPDASHIAVAGSRDNKHFSGLGASVETVVAYVDLQNLNIPLFIKEIDGYATKMEFDAEGKYLAANSSSTTEGGTLDNGTRVWDVMNGNPLTGWIKLTQEVSIGFNHDGKKLVVSTHDGTTQLWQIAEPSAGPVSNRLLMLYDGNDAVRSLINADGYILTVTDRQLVKLWKLPEEELMRANTSEKFADEEVSDTLQWYATFGNINDSIVLDSSHAVIIDRKTNKPYGKPLTHSAEVFFAKLSPDGKLVVTKSMNEVSVWRRDNQQKLYSFPFNEILNSVNFSADSKKIVTCNFNYSARVWDAISGKPLSPYVKHPFSSTLVENAVAYFTKDGSKIITYDTYTYRIWDVVTGEPLSAPIQLKTYYDNNTNDSIPASNKLLKPFSIKSLSNEDIKNYAELLSNHRVDVNGSLIRLTPAEYLEKWNKRKGKK